MPGWPTASLARAGAGDPHGLEPGRAPDNPGPADHTAFFSGSDGYMFTSTERASATQWRRYL